MLWVLFLLLAWAAAGVSCARLCLTSLRAAAAATDVRADHVHHCHRLTLYEAAFLSGGPARVADLTLVSMARGRGSSSPTPAGRPSWTRTGRTRWSAPS